MPNTIDTSLQQPCSKETLLFGSVLIAYELSYSHRKTLGIKVHPDGSVKVIAPMGSEKRKVEEKLRKKAPWILRQQLDFLAYAPITLPKRYLSGETHPYLGRHYRLRVTPAPYNRVSLYQGRLWIQHDNTAVADLLKDWYRQKALAHFEEALQKVLPLFDSYGINTPQLVVRHMPTRWGSCTAKGKLILNPQLVKASRGCIEYVLIHELCHLVHHNHTRAFYQLQERIMPDWQKWKERLEHSIT